MERQVGLKDSENEQENEYAKQCVLLLCRHVHVD